MTRKGNTTVIATKPKPKKSKLVLLSFVILFAAVGAYALFQSFAATVSAGLTANKTAVNKNDTFVVTVGTSTGTEPVSIGHIRLVFDPARVQYVSTDYTGSSFTNDTPDAGVGSGYVQLSRYTTTRPSGNLIIGKVTFKALASSGDVSVSVDADNSDIFSASDASDIMSGANSVTLKVNQVVSQPNTDPDPPNGGGSTKPDSKPPTVPRGDPVKPEPVTTTSSGQRVTRTDYYLNGELVGSREANEEPVTIDTENLAEGSYELTTRNHTADGTTEETKSRFEVIAKPLLKRLSSPVVITGALLSLVLVFLVIRIVYTHTVPFYRTLG